MTTNAKPVLVQYLTRKIFDDLGLEGLADAKEKFGHRNVLDLYKLSMGPGSYDAESKESIRQNLRNA